MEKDADALVTQSPAWVDSICASGRYADASRYYTLASGQRLLLPMVRWKGIGLVEASYPHAWGYGGLLAEQPLQAQEIASVFSDLVARRVLQVSIRPNPLHDAVWAEARPPFATATTSVSHILDLAGGFARVWKERFDSRTRNKVRKAQRSGLVVECDSTGRLVPVFYQLYQESVVRWARQQNEPLFLSRWRAAQRDPVQKFTAIAEVLADRCQIWVAWLDGRAVASIVVLRGRNSQYIRGAMDKELAAPTNANDLLLSSAIEASCRAGERYFHMGESGSSSSLAKFKERFGALPYGFSEYRLEKAPFSRLESRLRGAVKRLIRFKDAE